MLSYSNNLFAIKFNNEYVLASNFTIIETNATSKMYETFSPILTNLG